jgi:hypothetical protein
MPRFGSRHTSKSRALKGLPLRRCWEGWERGFKGGDGTSI